MKTIQEFQIDPLNSNNHIPNVRCNHENQKGSQNWDDLNVSFCKNCGMIIVKRWQQMDNNEMTFYITPYDAWKLFNYKFSVME